MHGLYNEGDNIMLNNLEKYLLQGKYTEVSEECRNLNKDAIRDTLMKIAYDTENICVYSFINYMIKKTENEEWIELAIEIMLNPLCFVEGAYSVALFHARELLIKERNVKNLERILFFHNIPEKLVCDKEAQDIAKEILATEADNVVALGINL